MYIRILFIVLALCTVFLSPALALLTGIVFALIFKHPFPRPGKKLSKYLLQISVVGLGFGINLYDSLQAGKEGILFTVVSVVGVMIIGWLIGRRLKVTPKMSYLISSGTAICGGSAIAAVAPVIDADENETSVSLAVIFLLNALALFIFPLIGEYLHLGQKEFGLWAAIAIHDTSSVVGAGKAYGPEALMVATTVKLTRALWIIPLSLVSILIYGKKKGNKISIPWFIFLFIAAMILSTFIPLPSLMLKGISVLSHSLLSVTLFLIGSSLSIQALRQVGARPILLGITLWIIISITSLLVITW
ncbi:MAG: putative sulfate exporter family transporter [Bacteroides sp.]|nr:putative sulfate exporter family transporter [Bacteroides sp.]